MQQHAQGSFEVKIQPDTEAKLADPLFGSLTVEKQFTGDLQATGKGTMLTAGTAVEGSAAYVLIERVTGTLHGKSGAFSLVHKGTMGGGAYHMDISIVPDSGSGELAGIAGTLVIKIEGKAHSYALDYTLGSAP